MKPEDPPADLAGDLARWARRHTETPARTVRTVFGLHVDEETYNTVGGYVLGRLGRRARVGDTVEVEGRMLRVEALDGLRVARVFLSRPPAPGAAAAGTRT